MIGYVLNVYKNIETKTSNNTMLKEIDELKEKLKKEKEKNKHLTAKLKRLGVSKNKNVIFSKNRLDSVL